MALTADLTGPQGFSAELSKEQGLAASFSEREAISARLALGGSGTAIRLVDVTLFASAWVGEESPYSQVVVIEGTTEYSLVDLQPSVEQLEIFHEKDLAFTTENEDGIVTVYAIGDKPTMDYIVQATVTEVRI